MGRTDRRAGTSRNCLFLATSAADALISAAMVDLWKRGWVDPVEPPPSAFHLYAQQVMALSIQEHWIPFDGVESWIGRMPAFAGMAVEKRRIIDEMARKQTLAEDGGMVWMGDEGKKSFGRRHFIALLSIFDSAPLFTVYHGRLELGAAGEIEQLRSELWWLDPEATSIVSLGDGRHRRWTFGGLRANAILASALDHAGCTASAENLYITIEGRAVDAAIASVIRDLGTRVPSHFSGCPNEQEIEKLKFVECLPPQFA